MPRHRVVGNLALSFLTKAASGYWNLFDPQNGYTAISREALLRLDLSRSRGATSSRMTCSSTSTSSGSAPPTCPSRPDTATRCPASTCAAGPACSEAPRPRFLDPHLVEVRPPVVLSRRPHAIRRPRPDGTRPRGQPVDGGPHPRAGDRERGHSRSGGGSTAQRLPHVDPRDGPGHPGQQPVRSSQ